MTEFELIYRYFKAQDTQKISIEHTSIVKDLGDDAAVVAINTPSQWVTCVDTLIQGRHFSADWQQVSDLAFAIGYKAVAVNISDIAAMGAKPHSILLALALPERLANETWLGEFAKGLFHACKQFGVRLIGGDTTRNDKLVISITANGMLPATIQPVYRSGAKVGDKIYVSGTIGDASYALNHPETEVGKQLAHRLHMPTPRSALGQKLASAGLVTAMMDVSDGLVQDLGHLCRQSKVAMSLQLDKLPTSKPLQQVELAERLHCQLTGGDDYELVFTLPASVQLSQIDLSAVSTQVTCIGEVTELQQAQPTSTANFGSSTLQLTYQGAVVTEQHPYPFASFPNLQGYQHFSS
ncbi:thiamine-phosphate kinase [Psychrobacter phenylpyruvicus]|uniref:Thiamine-monophosphate kinase n=1 Tax=Psychrobacter phenylpyruvicus TaxID=29432 RepID=A0A379LR73_9GAMM|nr:thiamine-phosphate kinase [Psychrobacter phenylpyruvicus]SUD92224.1 Thiamine-monophosphate kinase [Psychrobacter phenylpyruvicus]